MQTWLVLGGIMMFLAVALGAFGAHALKDKLTPDRLKNYQTGIQYQIAHGLGLLLLGTVQGVTLNLNTSLITVAGWLLVAGIVLFSGSLYVLSLTGIRKLGAITPLGGLCFLAGWVLFILAVV